MLTYLEPEDAVGCTIAFAIHSDNLLYVFDNKTFTVITPATGYAEDTPTVEGANANDWKSWGFTMPQLIGAGVFDRSEVRCAGEQWELIGEG